MRQIAWRQGYLKATNNRLELPLAHVTAATLMQKLYIRWPSVPLQSDIDSQNVARCSPQILRSLTWLHKSRNYASNLNRLGTIFTSASLEYQNHRSPSFVKMFGSFLRIRQCLSAATLAFSSQASSPLVRTLRAYIQKYFHVDEKCQWTSTRSSLGHLELGNRRC